MAAREKWARQEGRQEGIQENKQEIARSMLADAMSSDLVSKFTGLPIARCKPTPVGKLHPPENDTP